jgi:cephalosporin-C deacetylase-like acetyl esterase
MDDEKKPRFINLAIRGYFAKFTNKYINRYFVKFANKMLKKHPSELDVVIDNLSCFVTMNMAGRMTCSVPASLALKDKVCPFHMYLATYNRVTSDKDIVIYPFNGHERGGAVRTEVKM